MHPSTDKRQPKQNGSRGIPPSYPIYIVYPSVYVYVVELGGTSQLRCGCVPLP